MRRRRCRSAARGGRGLRGAVDGVVDRRAREPDAADLLEEHRARRSRMAPVRRGAPWLDRRRLPMVNRKGRRVVTALRLPGQLQRLPTARRRPPKRGRPTQAFTARPRPSKCSPSATSIPSPPAPRATSSRRAAPATLSRSWSPSTARARRTRPVTQSAGGRSWSPQWPGSPQWPQASTPPENRSKPQLWTPGSSTPPEKRVAAVAPPPPPPIHALWGAAQQPVGGWASQPVSIVSAACQLLESIIVNCPVVTVSKVRAAAAPAAAARAYPAHATKTHRASLPPRRARTARSTTR